MRGVGRTFSDCRGLVVDDKFAGVGGKGGDEVKRGRGTCQAGVLDQRAIRIEGTVGLDPEESDGEARVSGGEIDLRN